MSVSKEIREKIDTHKDLISFDIMSEVLAIPLRALKDGDVYISDINDEYDFILVCFHYRIDRLPSLVNKYSHEDYVSISKVRGVIVNLNTQKVVCKSYPATSNILIEAIPTTPEFRISDYIENASYELQHIFESAEKYNEYVVGALLRVFYVDGFVFISTHRKISFDRTKFGSDRSFREIFFSAQDCFKDQLEVLSEGGIVHTFILSSESLNIDSRKIIGEDKVYYISSFRITDNISVIDKELQESMKDRITMKNLTAEKRIHFPNFLEPEEVNSILNPSGIDILRTRISSSNSDIFESLKRQTNVVERYFQNGGKVNMITSSGETHSLVPPSAFRRTIFNDGKLDMKKTMCDSIGFFTEGVLSDARIFVDKGFTLETLREMANVLKSGENINFSLYPQINCSVFEKIVTNVFFSIPISKIDRFFEVVEEYKNDMRNAYRFVLSRENQIKTSIMERKFEEVFRGISKKKTILAYFKANFLACYNMIPKKGKCYEDIIGNGAESWWPEDVVEEFNRNKVIYSRVGRIQTSDPKVRNAISRNALICFVFNAPGTVHYSMINFEKYVTSFEKAMERGATNSANEENET